MKIVRLDLRAYGPFTGESLDFTPALHGLHLVYGPNEAGKSTTLRALRGLLYGIPLSCQDSFLHAGPDLDASRHDVALVGRLRANLLDVLVEQILEFRAAFLVTDSIHVGDIVGDYLHVELLGRHPCSGSSQGLHGLGSF